jgi:hypothetical protein
VKRYVTAGYVKDGEVHLRHTRKLEAEFKTWRNTELVVTFEKAYATRSVAMNDYYWAVVVARIAPKLKRSPNETHEILKAQFLPVELARTGVNGVLINGLVIGGSTTKLTKVQFFEEYLEPIVAWAAEKLDCYIPDPDPLWREHAAEEDARGVA